MSKDNALLAGAVGANQSGTIRMLLKGIAYQHGKQGEASVTDAINKVQGAGVSLLTIILTLMPIVLSLFSGQKIDLATIINAILALLPKGESA